MPDIPNVACLKPFEYPSQSLTLLEVDQKLRDARNQIYNATWRIIEVILGTTSDDHVPELFDAAHAAAALMPVADVAMDNMHLKHGAH